MTASEANTRPERLPCGCQYWTDNEIFHLEPCNDRCPVVEYVAKRAGERQIDLRVLDLRPDLPAMTCPHCEAKVEHHVSGDLGVARPEPDDGSICLYCLGASIYTDEMTLRLATDDEWRERGKDFTSAQLGVLAYIESLPADERPARRAPASPDANGAVWFV